MHEDHSPVVSSLADTASSDGYWSFTGRDTSQSILSILSMILYTSIMYPPIFFFSLYQTEESDTRFLLIVCSLVLLLAFSNLVILT